jgi:hypothetical protein
MLQGSHTGGLLVGTHPCCLLLLLLLSWHTPAADAAAT